TKKAIHLALLAMSIPFGLIGIVAGQIVAAVLSSVYYMHCSAKLIGYSWRAQLRDILEPVAAAALAAAGTAWLMEAASLPLAWQALAGAACFALLYLLLSHLGQVAGYLFLRERLRAWRRGSARKMAETRP